ncbi:MAG TPA: hypothetical protein VK151_02560 [Fluviicola sp.]|nr:hypothetical protein [Fluviicola sp.]
MANKRISELTAASSLTLTDLLALVNDAQTKKVTLSTLLSFIEAQDQFATLDSGGKIPLSQIPDSITGSLHYQTTWDADLNSPAIPTASATNKGWYYVVSVAGDTSVDSISDWEVGDWIISNGEAWQKIDNTDAVLSWNGRKGAVVPESGDYDTDDVTEAGNQYFTEARVLAALLAGLSTSTTSAVTSSDSVLSALGKLQGQVGLREVAANKGVAGGYAGLDGSGKVPTSQLPASVLGAASYQGAWNGTGAIPSTGTAEAGNKGWYYVVSTNNTTNVDGINDWKIGDWIISNGTAWQKVDNTDAISSWNGRTGAVIPMTNDYTTSQVSEEANLYFTTARVLATLLAGINTSQTTAITSSDSILTALGKAQGQIAARELAANKGVASGYASLDSGGKVPVSQMPSSVVGAVMYQGTWNGSGTPGTASTSKGHYYVLSANSSTVVDGTGDWKIGDWIISNGTIWQKVDNSDAVSSFAGRFGAVTPQSGDYTTTLVAEGTNKYYTAARVLAEVLSGINTSQTTAITSSDSVLTAFGKAQGQINAREFASNKGVSFGYAGLDAAGLVPRTQLPKGFATLSLDFTGYTVSGTTNDKLYGFSIPSGTFAAGDQLNVKVWFGGTSNANAKTLRVYFNTSNSLTGATLVGTFAINASEASAKFEREFAFITNTTTKAGVAAATSSRNGEYGATADAAITIPSVSAGFWVIIAGQKAQNTDTMKVERIELSALYG